MWLRWIWRTLARTPTLKSCVCGRGAGIDGWETIAKRTDAGLSLACQRRTRSPRICRARAMARA